MRSRQFFAPIKTGKREKPENTLYIEECHKGLTIPKVVLIKYVGHNIICALK